MADTAAILDIRTDDFINSKSPCGPNASHQVWAQSDLGFGSRCGFRDFQDGCPGSHQPSWIAKLKDLSNSETVCHSNASHQVSAQSN